MELLICILQLLDNLSCIMAKAYYIQAPISVLKSHSTNLKLYHPLLNILRRVKGSQTWLLDWESVSALADSASPRPRLIYVLWAALFYRIDRTWHWGGNWKLKIIHYHRRLKIKGFLYRIETRTIFGSEWKSSWNFSHIIKVVVSFIKVTVNAVGRAGLKNSAGSEDYDRVGDPSNLPAVAYIGLFLATVCSSLLPRSLWALSRGDSARVGFHFQAEAAALAGVSEQ